VVKPLFWSEEFCELHSDINRILEISVNINSNVSIPYKIADTRFKSPGIGTFGGFYGENDPTNWIEIWNKLIEVSHEIDSFEISFPPKYFEIQKFEAQIQASIELFNPKCVVELNQHVVLVSDATESLSKGNRKKYRQFCEASGTVKRGKIEDLKKVVALLQESRKNLGVDLSMSYVQILEAFTKMPEIYRCYFAEIEAEIVAAAIVVEISRESLYVLYWGDTPGYWRKTSPVVAIFMEVYKDAYQEGFKYLDLGISSVDGEINPGLTRFKRNLGCIDSEKIKVLFYNPDSRA
jgi:hypothetical protein